MKNFCNNFKTYGGTEQDIIDLITTEVLGCTSTDLTALYGDMINHIKNCQLIANCAYSEQCNKKSRNQLIWSCTNGGKFFKVHDVSNEKILLNKKEVDDDSQKEFDDDPTTVYMEVNSGNPFYNNILKDKNTINTIGHDLPVWDNIQDDGNNIMIISHDPLRNKDLYTTNHIVLSTPFGYHDADYRTKKGKPLDALIREIQCNSQYKDCGVYVTDLDKYYALNAPKKNKVDFSKIQNSNELTFKDILVSEIKIIQPKLIILLGIPVCDGRFGKGNYKLFERKTFLSYDYLPVYHISNSNNTALTAFENGYNLSNKSSLKWYQIYASLI